jgi:hypothetical protein
MTALIKTDTKLGEGAEVQAATLLLCITRARCMTRAK